MQDDSPTTPSPPVIGVDIGGTNIAAGFVDPSGKLIRVSSRPTPIKSASSVLIAAAELVEELQGIVGSRPGAVGVGLPGLVSSEKGVAVWAANLPWDRTDVSGALRERLGLPIFIQNDGNAAALGEKWFGAAQHVSRFVCISVGTGIGSGVVIGGALLPDNDDRSVELGHVIVKLDGPLCGCGSRGCLEALAAGPSLSRRMREWYGRTLTGEELFSAAREGDEQAQHALEDAVSYLAAGVVNAWRLFGPDLLILAGGVASAGDQLLLPLRRYLTEFAPKEPEIAVSTVISGLENRAGVLGAAAVALEGLGRRPSPL